jgi:ABC-type multidrug transport system ATPase subunit
MKEIGRPAVSLAWREVTFEIPRSRSDRKALALQSKGIKPPTHKTILASVSGHLPAGSLTAIMGASGAGKTTLLNFLSNRTFYLKKIKYSGKVYLNGHERSEVDFNNFVAYVMQDNVLIETMTTRELLNFTAKLRLPSDKVSARVDEVVQQLELTKILDSRMGGILSRGISGGERKRVAIAMEILTDPCVLFLDEPTTGLDSFSAENVIGLCGHLASLGKTVCFTIHQPNSYIFSMFQSLIILADTKAVFQGDARTAMDYFEEKGFAFPSLSNPAEQIIDVLSEKGNTELFPQHNDTSQITTADLPSYSARHHPGVLLEMRLLMERFWRNYYRNKLMLRLKVALKLLFIFVIVTSYWQIGQSDNFESVTNRSGFLAFFLISTSFDGVSSIQACYDAKAQYVREQANRTYHPLCFYLSGMVSELPFEITQTVLYNAVVYLGVGLSLGNWHQILVFLLLNVIAFMSGKAFCNMLLFGFQNISAAAAIMPLTVVLPALFGGFFINFGNIPSFLYGIAYLSIFRYAWSAAVLNEFETFDSAECGFMPQCDVSTFFDIELSMWENIVIAIMLTIAEHLLAYCILYRFSKAFRK